MGVKSRGLRKVDRVERPERVAKAPARVYKMSASGRRFHNSLALNKGLMGCVPGWTEVLTPGGWRRIDEWSGEAILQWEAESGEAKFLVPDGWVKKPCPDGMLRFDAGRHFAMTVTEDHRVPCWDWAGRFRVKEAGALAKRLSKHRVPTTWAKASDGDILDDEGRPMSLVQLQLWIAIAADGHYPKMGRQCCFTLRKDRKVARLRTLLRACGIPWKEATGVRGDGAVEHRLWFRRPAHPKHLDWRWSAVGWWIAPTLLEEAWKWDGLASADYDRFDSTDKTDADVVQYLAHCCGRNATLRREEPRSAKHAAVWHVYAAKRGSKKNRVMLRCDGTEVERVPAADGMQYCFQTQTGFFVARQDGVVFVTGNCVGNGKTVTVVHDLWFRSEGQVPDPRDGVRRSRWFVIRNTYQQLMNSTVKTWMEWFPDTEMKYSPHPHGWLRRPSMRGDGTTVEIELLFFALDKPEQERDLLGVEATGAWINEAREISEDHLGSIQSRIGRFPPTRDDYKPLSLGILMDTNPPDDQSWWFRLAEVEKPEGWEFVRCPPALLRREDKAAGRVWWEPNDGRDPAVPPAENIEHLAEGFNYYLKQASVWSDAKMRVMVAGEYGTVLTGAPVYPQWQDEANLLREGKREVQLGLPVFVGTDGGRTPCAVALQVLRDGQVVVLGELCAENVSCGEFAERFLRPWLVTEFKASEGARLMIFHDPSGMAAGNTSDGVTEIEAMRRCGLPVVPCPCAENSVALRLECVREGLRRRMPSGQGGLVVVGPRCPKLVAGFRGRYHYRKLNTSSMDKRYADAPYKDEWSHVQDALQYGVYGALHPDGGGVDPLSTGVPDTRLYLPSSWRGSDAAREARATGVNFAGWF